jgi:G:T-mismatch repair DNA endonuclease (very short patch repair protein)
MNPGDYFIFSFSKKGNKPIFKILLNKSIFNKDTPFFVSSSGKKIPISSSSLKYFLYFADEHDLAEQLYSFRKKFFNINYCTSYWKDRGLLSQEDIKTCEDFLISSKEKERKNYIEATSSDSYKNNLKNSRPAATEKIRALAKKRFENPEYKKRAISAMHSDESKKKRVISFKKTMSDPDMKDKFLVSVNKKERTDSISKKHKELWKNLSQDKKELQLDNLRYKKRYTLNNKKMNLNEFIVGSILSEFQEDWRYEDLVKFQDKSYYPDFKIEEKKLIIECYGSFWHADPKLYLPEDMPLAGVTAKIIWEKDSERVSNLQSLGYNVFVIWESDIHKDREVLRSIIKNAIGA